jgi:hypothetical protein
MIPIVSRLGYVTKLLLLHERRAHVAVAARNGCLEEMFSHALLFCQIMSLQIIDAGLAMYVLLLLSSRLGFGLSDMSNTASPTLFVHAHKRNEPVTAIIRIYRVYHAATTIPIASGKSLAWTMGMARGTIPFANITARTWPALLAPAVSINTALSALSPTATFVS